MDQIRLLVFDEEPLMGTLIASIVNEEDDLVSTGVATTLPDALEGARETDVVVISTSVPDRGAFAFLRAIDEKDYDCKVVIMGLGDSEKELLAYIEAGIDAYVPREGGVEDLLTNIRAAAKSEAHASPQVVGLLIDRITELARLCEDIGIEINGDAELTDREQEVLELVAEGLSNQEIADRLYIEVGTVKNHVHRLLTKLNVSNRKEAARYFRIVSQKD